MQKAALLLRCSPSMTRCPVLLAAALRCWCLALLATSVPRRCSCEGNLLRGLNDPKTVEAKDHHPPIESPPPPVSTAAIPLHATDGTHHVYVYVGSPPQRRTLIVDTGSRLMAFPCEPCLSCGRHASESYYDPAISTTDRPSKCGECQFLGLSVCQADQQRCTFVQRYTEGSSLTAYEVEDLIWMGTDDAEESVRSHIEMAVPFCFGCQTSESGLFRTQYADGIVGLAMHRSSILQAFYDAGSIKRNAFALCLDRAGGTLSLGGTGLGDLGRHLEPMRYTPLVKDSGWYVIEVMSLHVGEILVTTDAVILDGFNSDKGTIIDSGTTDTYLPKVVAAPVQAAWEKITGLPYSNKMQQFTVEEFQKLPSVTITLRGGLQWTIPPESYMESPITKKVDGSSRGVRSKADLGAGWHGKRAFTNRMYLDEPKGCVLGGNAMNGHDILFDITGKTVGIARANCEYRSSDS